MAIGTIGAVSAAAEIRPPAAGEKVESIVVKGAAKTSLVAGKYVVSSETDTVFHDGDKYLGVSRAGSSFSFELAADSTDITLEDLNPTWKYDSLNAAVPDGFPYQGGFPHFSDDGLITAYQNSTGHIRISTDGGLTYGSEINSQTIWPGMTNGFHLSGGVAVAPNGTIYVAPYHTDGNSHKVKYSTNNGASWNAISVPNGSYSGGNVVTRVGNYILTMHAYNGTSNMVMYELFDTTVSASSPAGYWYSNFSYNAGSMVNQPYYLGLYPVPGTLTVYAVRYNGNSYQNDYALMNLSTIPGNGSNIGYNSSWNNNDSNAWDIGRYVGGNTDLSNYQLIIAGPRNSNPTPYWGVYWAGATGSASNTNIYGDTQARQGEGYSSSPYFYGGSVLGAGKTITALGRYTLRAGDNGNILAGTATTYALDQSTSENGRTWIKVKSSSIEKFQDYNSGSSSQTSKMIPGGNYFLTGKNLVAASSVTTIYKGDF